MPPTETIATKPDTAGGFWFRELTGYQWFVLLVCTLGWVFDCMGQQLFAVARTPAVAGLLGLGPKDATVAFYGGIATSLMLIGWATGGIIFGILGDRIGRAKTMVMTILLYSIFTGLSGMARGFTDFVVYRFLCGLGVGGQFSIGVTLVAEYMPARARPRALALLQALANWGNMGAALIAMGFAHMEKIGTLTTWPAWRWTLAIGALPAVMAIPVFRKLKEPESWQKAVAGAGPRQKAGSLAELFGDPRWRRSTIVGMVLASAGVIGLWGIGFFTMDLIHSVFEPKQAAFWAPMTSVLLNLGGFFGAYGFSYLTAYIGRRWAFAVAFVLAGGSTCMTFLCMKTPHDVYWMVPLMGVCQFLIFGGYAVYFPELYPTRLRSTGTSFCYNIGRYVAAAGPFSLGLLTSKVFVHSAQPMRYAGASMCLVFLLALLALPFAPETRGKPLPE
jgi:MFS family permease